jgi:hypothetical protein
MKSGDMLACPQLPCPCSTDLGWFGEDIYEGAKKVAKKAKRTVSKAAKAVLPDKLVDVVENLAEEYFDFAIDEALKMAKDPHTWAIVGAAALSIATMGAAAGPAVALAVDALMAAQIARVSGDAWSKLPAAGKRAVIDELRKAGGKKYTKARNRLSGLLRNSPEFIAEVEAARATLNSQRQKRAAAARKIERKALKALQAEAKVALDALGTQWTGKGRQYPSLRDNLVNTYVEQREAGAPPAKAFDAAAALLPAVAAWHVTDAFPDLAGDPATLERAAAAFVKAGGMRDLAKGTSAVRSQGLSVPQLEAEAPESEEAAAPSAEKSGASKGLMIGGAVVVAAVIAYAVTR